VAETKVALDGAIAALLLRIVDTFTRDLTGEASVRGKLSLRGIEGADADAVWQFVSGHAADVTRLRANLPGLIGELGSSSPDLATLIQPVADLWKVVASLADGAPAIPMPDLPDAGSYLDIALGEAVEQVLADLSPASWAIGRSLHLVGPGRPIVDAITGFLADPTGYLWARLDGERRNLDITLAGLVTGPQVTSVLTIPADDDRSIAPEVAAVFPTARVVIGRITFRLAVDTYDDPIPITFEVLGTEAAPPAFVAAVLRTPGWLKAIDVSPHLRLVVDPLNSPLGIGIAADGSVVPIAAGQPSLAVNSTFATSFSFGAEGGLQIELGKPLVEANLDMDAWGLRAGVEEFSVRIPPTVLGPILGMLLPRNGIDIRGRLIFKFDGEGLRLDGGVGLVATWPESLRLPGLVVHSLKTALEFKGPALGLAATGTVVVGLGPLTVTIEGLGLKQHVALAPDGNGNVGLLQIDTPDIAMPSGLGVRLDASIVKGGGFLRVEGDEIAGALELALALGSLEIEIRAVGVLSSIDGRVSLIVVMSIQFTPAIELFLGLTLNAVGGIFGFNRTVDREGLGALVRSGRVGDVLFPDDLVARANEVIAAVKQVFPPKADQYVVGPMLRLGWGRPISFVTADVALLVTFPDPAQFLILGQFRLALPTADVALINLQAGFAGGIDLSSGVVWFDASLERSTIGLFDVAGDVALRAGPSGFLFSAGGFHPRFVAPANVPALRRLSIAISPSPILRIGAEAYFAVTASTLQFGAGVHMEAELGPIGAKGFLTLDVLIHTEPHLLFLAELTGGFALTFSGEEVASIHLDVLLEGPGRWHAHAHASIELLFIEVSGTIELAWGEDAGGLLPAVDVADRVREALKAPTVWSHVMPLADAGLVTLRDGADGLHPLGSLRLTQTLAPLRVALERFGASPVTSADPVVVTITTAGAGTPTRAEELFAPAQFFQMTDDERLSKPPFIPFEAGSMLAGDAYSAAVDPVTVDIVYEEFTTPPEPGGSGLLVKLSPDWLSLATTGAAGRHHAADGPIVPRRDLGLREPGYAVADAVSGRRLGDVVGKSLVATSIRRSADTVLVAEYELRGGG
jgi:hypothetical protein